MTHGDIPKWIVYLMTAVMAVLLSVAWRFGGRRINLLVDRHVPQRLDLIRQGLKLVLVLIFSFAVAVAAILLGVLVLYLIGG